MNHSDAAVALRVWGEWACFTRPEMKVERVSYDVMTPASARGILEAILWKPAIRWIVTRIDVLKPIRWASVRRNELGGKIPLRNITDAMNKGHGQLGTFIEEDRQQRASLFLRDVEYLIHARFEMTKEAGPDDNPVKFREMFERRAEKGQCFNQPYLGCREFSAFFLRAKPTESTKMIDETRDLGWMLYDLDYSGQGPMPRFFRARLEKGTLAVPAPESKEVRG